uniref:RxLR effector protein n=1 Tax=Phytophthora agathidicida TaxID=1642459 RepID=A0A7G4WI46_9STRA|nr:PaRXLR57 [Phytophthora agathidicida]
MLYKCILLLTVTTILISADAVSAVVSHDHAKILPHSITFHQDDVGARRNLRGDKEKSVDAADSNEERVGAAPVLTQFILKGGTAGRTMDTANAATTSGAKSLGLFSCLQCEVSLLDKLKYRVLIYKGMTPDEAKLKLKLNYYQGDKYLRMYNKLKKTDFEQEKTKKWLEKYEKEKATVRNF